MKLGTKSVLFGAHCFFLHPWFVAAAWTKLFGFPRDIRLWVAFFIHDLGYIGKAEMDSAEGEEHPVWAARVMSALFDRKRVALPPYIVVTDMQGRIHDIGPWGAFCLLHSRFYAKRLYLPYSKLCVADKLAIALTPAWLYLPMVTLTGEVEEYMATYGTRSVSSEVHLERLAVKDKREWFGKLQPYMRRWVEEHKDLRPDTWTNRQPVDASGVYQ